MIIKRKPATARLFSDLKFLLQQKRANDTIIQVSSHFMDTVTPAVSHRVLNSDPDLIKPGDYILKKNNKNEIEIQLNSNPNPNKTPFRLEDLISTEKDSIPSLSSLTPSKLTQSDTLDYEPLALKYRSYKPFSQYLSFCFKQVIASPPPSSNSIIININFLNNVLAPAPASPSIFPALFFFKYIEAKPVPLFCFVSPENHSNHSNHSNSTFRLALIAPLRSLESENESATVIS